MARRGPKLGSLYCFPPVRPGPKCLGPKLWGDDLAMKVLHITHSAQGGAGLAACRAVEACRSAGVDAELLAVRDIPKGSGTLQLEFLQHPKSPKALISSALNDKMQWEYVNESRNIAWSNSLFSIPYPSFDLAKSAFVMAFDVIHLHWVSWLASPRSIAGLLDAGKPVVWTMHDFWPATGGCHYPSGCKQFLETCRKCPQLDDVWSIAYNFFCEKRSQYGGHPNLTIVTPSDWLAGQVAKSAMFSRNQVVTLRNPLDNEIYSPLADRKAARAAIGVGPEDVAIAFGNYDNAEERKGGSILRDAINRVSQRWNEAQAAHNVGRLVLLVFGRTSEMFEGAGVSVLPIGVVAEEARVAAILGACDAYAHPAIEDNYPNTVLESLGVGTPVVGFVAGGLPEMVEDGLTGFLAARGISPAEDAASLATAFERMVAMPKADRERMRVSCRRSVLMNNSYAAIGPQLRDLYRSLAPNALAVTDPEASARRRSILASVAVPACTEMGEKARQFPLGIVMGRMVESVMAPEFPPHELLSAPYLLREPPRRPELAAPSPERRRRILIVRTIHSHHTGSSGPTQFIKHLDPDRFIVREVGVPIGDSLAPRGASDIKRVVRDLGARGFANQGNAIVAELAVLRAALGGEADLIHYIDGDIAGWLTPQLRSLYPDFKARTIATFHQPPAVLRPLLSYKRLRAFDRIVTLCEEQDAFVRDYVGHDRTTTIPHGIDTDAFAPSESPEDVEPTVDRPLRLLAVGRWLRDYRTLREATNILRNAGLPFTMDLVVGPDEMGMDEPGRRYHVNLSDEKLRALYRQSDLLCLPLEDATANNSLLEAAASGLPIVTTRIGGVPDYLPAATAVLTPKGDAAAVAAAVLRLAATPARRAAMRVNVRARALELSWPTIATMHAKLYDEVLA